MWSLCDVINRDPFDRMLAGQALVEQMAIVTADPAFATFGVQIFW
jgi:PIN domain nuclease of toxin-antitoxin system